jgi:hypothetical protein
VAASVNLHITVDALAPASNACTARYQSEFPEPGSDAVDALSILDWAASLCPVCGAPHWDIVLPVGKASLFPSPVMLRSVLAKAIEDRAC